MNLFVFLFLFVRIWRYARVNNEKKKTTEHAIFERERENKVPLVHSSAIFQQICTNNFESMKNVMIFQLLLLFYLFCGN